MHVIIDADTIAFGNAVSAENDELWVATSRANQAIESIIQACEADSYELWLTGPNNFRYQLFPEYKANRHNTYRPKWEGNVKLWMIDEWGAQLSEGCEADDMCVTALMSTPNSIVAHLDKDLNMGVGWHYNWELVRLNKVIREAKKYYVDEEEALRFFYYQLLVGDSTDGIKGVVGIGPKKANEILNRCNTPAEMLQSVRDLYSCDEELELNAGCLWMWRKLGDTWTLKTHGHLEDVTAS